MAKARQGAGDAAVRKAFEDGISASEALLKRMGVTEQQMLRVSLNALVQSQIQVQRGKAKISLADCSPESIKLALIKCLNAGLVPDGEEVALVPLRSGDQVYAEAWPGIVGRLKNARIATPGLSIWAKTAWEYDDEFTVIEGLRPDIIHRPSTSPPARKEGDVLACYAVVELPGQPRPEFEVLYRADIDRHRSFARAKGGPWSQGHYWEMGERSALGLVLKRLPKRANDLRDPLDRDPDGAAASAIDVPAALEHQPSRPASDLTGRAAESAEPARQARGGGKRAERAAPAPAEPEQPPIESYAEEVDDDPFK